MLQNIRIFRQLLVKIEVAFQEHCNFLEIVFQNFVLAVADKEFILQELDRKDNVGTNIFCIDGGESLGARKSQA